LLAGLIFGPGNAFAVPKPEYLQGVQAANSMMSKGRIDFVTRSRIEATQVPKAMEEIRMQQDAMRRQTPTKAERLFRAREQMLQIAKVAEIPA